MPDEASPQLVKVAAFGHEHIAASQLVPSDIVARQVYLGDCRKIEESVLNVGHAKIRAPLQLSIAVIFAQSDARLKARHVFQPHHSPVSRRIPKPLDPAG